MKQDTEPALRFAAVILAAGGSTRFGRPKQLLEIDGQPLVLRAAQAAAGAGASAVTVVLGAAAAEIAPVLAQASIATAMNPEWKVGGMASSIRAGLRSLWSQRAELDGVLLLLCDQPALTSGVLRRILDLQRASGRSMAAARYSGRLGTPALFLRGHFERLAALTGDEGARGLLNEDPLCVAVGDFPELAIDLDTPADYEAWLRRV